MRDYLRIQHQSPESYLLSKFKDHDVVFLGENHRIKHDVELVQRMIPLLYQNGIYTLCTEFARREDQPLIDSLLRGPSYDEALARKISFNNFVFWGYQEYVDIFKWVWQLNHSLPEGSRKFRILGVNDSPDWSFIKTQEDRDKDEVKKQVWRGGGEEFWAKVILDEVVAKGEKALVYSGIHHAFTEYKQPIYDPAKGFIRFEDTRMGNFVYRAISKRAITVYLHAPWPSTTGYDAPYVRPVDGIIDAVMKQMPADHRRVGFDTKGTPCGDLPGTTSLYKYGYKRFTLSTFCDGYIYQMPFSEYQGVTPIPDFVNMDNLETARLQSPNPWFRTASPADFNDAIRQDADMPRRIKELAKE